jgi:hypothetical protein
MYPFYSIYHIIPYYILILIVIPKLPYLIIFCYHNKIITQQDIYNNNNK